MTPVTTILLHGDTTQLLAAWPPTLPNGPKFGRVDACITDPPYFVNLDAHAAEGRQAWDSAWKTAPEFQAWVKKWSRCIEDSVLWPGGFLLAFCAARTSHLMQGGIEQAGLGILDMAIWLYATGQVKQKTALKPAFEPITIACKGTKKTATAEFKENGRALLHSAEMSKAEGRHPLNVVADGSLREVESSTDEEAADLAKVCDGWKFMPVAKPSPKERDFGCESLDIRQKEGGISGCEVLCNTCGFIENAMSREQCKQCGSKDVSKKSSISGASGLARNIHPTVKPVDLMRRLIRLTTKPGAWVLDPFMGSGTTGIACILEGRNFIGIEREKDFHEISEHRIAAAHALVQKLGRTLGPTEAFGEVAFG